jgi:hypothetical protein
MKRANVLLVAALLVQGACGDTNDTAAPARPASAEQPRGAAPGAPPPEPTMGADGALLPSNEKVAGLTLPRGLEPVHEADGTHRYTTSAPIEKVLAYFGPRLFTAEVERVGDGAIYRHARPLEARGSVVLLDVSVLGTSRGQVRVEVREAPPPPAEVSNTAADRAAFTKRLRALD